jgi:hypothetical protein
MCAPSQSRGKAGVIGLSISPLPQARRAEDVRRGLPVGDVFLKQGRENKISQLIYRSEIFLVKSRKTMASRSPLVSGSAWKPGQKPSGALALRCSATFTVNIPSSHRTRSNSRGFLLFLPENRSCQGRNCSLALQHFCRPVF